jgi:3',5'-nucleoside bisphosphate phosphatase
LFGPQGNLEPILEQPLTVEEIEAEGDNITRRHFAEVLTHQHGLDREKVNRLISNHSPAYIPSGIEMNLLQPLFERFSMVRVLAHAAAGSFPAPSVYNEVLPPLETVESILPELLTLGLDGLEIYYPGHTPEHIEELKEWSKRHSLLVTGGSDFHDRLHRPLGIAGVNRCDLDVLLARVK